MKIIKKLQKASKSKDKKEKKNLAKKIDKKILKALKDRYLKSKKEHEETKAAYELALSFFKKNNTEEQEKKKKKKKKSSSKKSAPKKSKNKKPAATKKKSTPAKKPKSNAKVTLLSDLPPTPAEVSKKLPKPLRIKKPKAAPANNQKSAKSPAPAKPKTTATPKPVAKLPRVTPKKVVAKPTTRRQSAPKKPTVTKRQMEDLKVVEGVGPAIERVLKSNGIKTLTELGKARIATLRGILENAGSRFRFHKPDTWARQARMAASGKWKQFTLHVIIFLIRLILIICHLDVYLVKI